MAALALCMSPSTSLQSAIRMRAIASWHAAPSLDGAARAAKDAQWDGVQTDDSLGLLISCIGRKLMLGQRIQEEVEAVHSEWGGAPTIGFYSYGEIGPHGATGRCMLHNQTMTALLLTERRAA